MGAVLREANHSLRLLVAALAAALWPHLLEASRGTGRLLAASAHTAAYLGAAGCAALSRQLDSLSRAAAAHSRTPDQLPPFPAGKRAARSAALLASTCGLLVSVVLLLAALRGGQPAAAAAAGGARRGAAGARSAVQLQGPWVGGGGGTEDPLSQLSDPEYQASMMQLQLAEQGRRVQEVEMLLAEQRQEAQQVRMEKDELAKERVLLEGRAKHAQHELEVLLKEAQAALHGDSLVMGDYLRGNAPALRKAWALRCARQARRGIVMSAGGAVPLTNAFVTLHVLRHHLNCTLPVALMYWGASKADVVDPIMMSMFKENIPGLQLINASALPYPPYHRPLSPDKEDGRFAGWKVKVFSIYAAPFQEVLYLDSDSTPLLDPSFLFTAPQYRASGNLYWADFYQGDVPWIKAERLFELLQLENPFDKRQGGGARQTEAGQFLINRTQHWDVLEWALFLNTHDEVTYRTVHGDKDTFRAAFHLAGKAGEYQQVAHYPALSLTDTVIMQKRYHQRGVVQLAPNGTLLFHHRAGPLGKFDLMRREPTRATTHVTARASADLGTACVFSGSLTGEAVGGMWEKQVLLVTPSTCNYSTLDWPRAQTACAPGYDQNLPGTDQLLPIFEVPAGSHVARAEAAADAAFSLMAQKLGIPDMYAPWD